MNCLVVISIGMVLTFSVLCMEQQQPSMREVGRDLMRVGLYFHEAGSGPHVSEQVVVMQQNSLAPTVVSSVNAVDVLENQMRVDVYRSRRDRLMGCAVCAGPFCAYAYLMAQAMLGIFLIYVKTFWR